MHNPILFAKFVVMNIRSLLVLLSVIIFSGLSANASFDITGSRYLTVTPAKTTGLEMVYVVENLSDASIVCTSTGSVTLYRFGSAGGGYAEEVARSGSSTLTYRPKSGDSGFIVEENGRQTAYWVVDYSLHYPTLTSLTISPESDCDRVIFNPAGSFDRINYYSVNGAPVELDREIKLEFNDLQILENEEQPSSWQQYVRTANLAEVQGTFSVQAPLCDTRFHLSGDRFLEEWGDPVYVSTDSYTTRRVEAVTSATQVGRENDNEQNSSSTGLGGSAPCDITFKAVVTDAAIFHEWQFSNTENFDDVLYRFTEEELTYTFTEFGLTYVRFVCADSSGECEYIGDTYTVQIGESKLLCPNAFSPQNQDGVNDEWKVSYSSLISYDCHIFNRWGKELFSSTNPAEGWDGKVGGKIVPSGVYFYVIKAEGADGIKYNLSGDINIVGSKLRPTSESGE